ncbi:pseudouridine-5'-phosphate glycosidase [Carboxydothermus hydrogenoformans]|uniref:Pseudouridine-5'-phosphate glycosidase n=1 Tax=Carboxydothermus hydrogenoformans (strain ATCC BAA-161 / DSM 6008 / Z-2901) TaxID=246194 RepID=Q3AFY5_CARHZ|nr:pseudouridine-5'-phosphate glycosidase [Carboxydothermus hydrogenoformans]ABB15680.1 indigoidine systhesis protein, homolog [Carboxydothermus hydrogenoformans Z-2901]
MNEYLVLSKEVKEALAEGVPVVALESTIIAHGMPHPQNVETALAVEKVVRENEAVPATIAVIGGKIKVGLTCEEIEYLGEKGPEVIKVSRRDLPYVVAKGLDGATTVAATMFIAAMSGIKVFATGGIGGVHRGGEKSFDISADLQELARTNVAVVSAGVKSILDIGLTLEYLETYGVPVIGFGTDEFPAFYTRKSGYKVHITADTPAELARIIKVKWDLGLKGGVVVANPIPEEYSLDYEEITRAIDSAVLEAAEKGVRGKEVTPYLLAKVKDITGGKSLEANIQLVLNNARLAAKLAQELSKL